MIIENRPSGPLFVNTYLVYDEDSKKGFIVDPGGYDPRMYIKLEAEEIKIDYIVLTHGHADHIGGIEMYKTHYPDIKVVAFEAEKEVLNTPFINSSLDICGHEISMDADIYVTEEDTLDIGNMHLEFIHTPGHTPGGMCIKIGDVLFSGDTLFQYSIGRTDFPGGDFETLRNSIQEKLFKLPDETKVYPGHMGTTEIGKEKRANPFVCIR